MASSGASDSTPSPADDSTPKRVRKWVLDERLPNEPVPLNLAGRDSTSRAQKIADAESAGPPSVTRLAAIIDRAAEEGGLMLPLRGGNNGWACVPDDPITPAHDPVCLNGSGQKWASAVYKGDLVFEPEGLGIGYKLQGGAIASATDPYQVRPLPDEEWIIEPPHIILIFEDTTGLGHFPTKPENGGPWVSWVGTPFMHVKVPVSD